MAVEKITVHASCYVRGRSCRLLIPVGTAVVRILVISSGMIKAAHTMPWSKAIAYEEKLLRRGWEPGGSDND